MNFSPFSARLEITTSHLGRRSDVDVLTGSRLGRVVFHKLGEMFVVVDARIIIDIPFPVKLARLGVEFAVVSHLEE
jgi:hypothetical protein